MDPLLILVAIVAIVGGLFYSAYEQKVKLQIAKEKNQNKGVSDDAQAEIDRLKERVAVLEKIVTDKNYSLKSEIESLDRVS
ncbi:hypothetical protein J1N51_06085 [Psychrosphaera ytuae]|uniref:Nitrite reductase n=1 Tax=Psychrosphaera ytuae TaxID=2820710 RepID=A0A975DD77_9GAMM|nr:hypothetical protein [Psychrosphaera ytuae]QTH65012.1 hypothetical protein J1N51_06085 [Psychrosphaera ytuae]